MRWSIIRLIWLRELRDQMRDRRTLFMIAVLPLLLYPVLGYAILQFALTFRDKPSTIGLVRGPGGSNDFPEAAPSGAATSLVPITAWFSFTPGMAGCALERLAGAMGLASAAEHFLNYPPLVRKGLLLSPDGKRLKFLFLKDGGRAPLEEKQVDLILSAPADFFLLLEKAQSDTTADPPPLQVQWRKEDDLTRQAFHRLLPVLESWKNNLQKVRLARKGLPSQFDNPFVVQMPGAGKLVAPSENLFDLLVRIFPFMLVLWSLAGALYPAVDLCAGEKERGTMETLLISPAAREEIVLGKFLTIWVFSALTAFLNLASMGLTTWQFSTPLSLNPLTFGALFWCVVLVLPLSAFFSAISLAIGAYARSSKEGQHYLMPLFLVTMPLIFLTLAPGVELSPFYSLVPVTGVALLMQRLMAAPSLNQVPWLYFLPVLAPVALYSWMALRWAIFQFQREEVLFREAERLDIRLWLRRLFREKEALPTTGQALFCFALILGLRWLTLGLGSHLPALVHTGVSLPAFVAAPALVMAVVLNTRPGQGLALRWPQVREMGVAAVLALLLLPPLAASAMAVFDSFPDLTRLLEEGHPLVTELRNLGLAFQSGQPSWLAYFLVFGLLASVCEELAFRGFILSGLLHSLRPRNAILLSSFLFALFHMNVFQLLPTFLLGVVLGLLRVRSQSLVPAMVFHLLHNSILIGSMYAVHGDLPALLIDLWPAVIAVCSTVGLGLLWWLYRKPYLAVQKK